MIKQTPKIDINKLEIKAISLKTTHLQEIPQGYFTADSVATFEVKLNPLFNIDDNVIKIELSLGINVNHNKKPYKNVGVFEYDFLFGYSGLSSLLDSEGKLSPEIFVTCSSISYSTLRGIIYSNTLGTCLENLILPVISGKELINNIKD